MATSVFGKEPEIEDPDDYYDDPPVEECQICHVLTPKEAMGNSHCSNCAMQVQIKTDWSKYIRTCGLCEHKYYFACSKDCAVNLTLQGWGYGVQLYNVMLVAEDQWQHTIRPSRKPPLKLSK